LIPALALAFFAWSAPAGIDPSKWSAAQAKQFQDRSDSIAKASIAARDSASRADSGKSAADSLSRKALPPRVMPLSDQMMYAGGFMVFLALMVASLQNLNPND
jgi:hypothetical protein